MKILLIGEFSGVHNNLKTALEKLGHNAILMSDGDSWKGFSKGIKLTRLKKKGLISYIKNMFYFIKTINELKSQDVIQFINPMILPLYAIVYLYFYKKFTHTKFVYYACGTDPAFLNSKDRFSYFPFDDNSSDEMPSYHSLRLAMYNLFIAYQDAIVPAMYTYAVGYEQNSYLKKPIPLPGEGNYLQKKKIGKPLKILFGISRKDFKGADYILSALKEIGKTHSGLVEITTVEKVPYTEYVKILENHNVLIDQCKTYDYGMNAVIGLEKGLLVLSGSEDIAIEYRGISKSEVINIVPKVEQICSALLEILELNEKELLSKSKASIDFARKHHNPLRIAKSFVDEVYTK